MKERTQDNLALTILIFASIAMLMTLFWSLSQKIEYIKKYRQLESCIEMSDSLLIISEEYQHMYEDITGHIDKVQEE